MFTSLSRFVRHGSTGSCLTSQSYVSIWSACLAYNLVSYISNRKKITQSSRLNHLNQLTSHVSIRLVSRFRKQTHRYHFPPQKRECCLVEGRLRAKQTKLLRWTKFLQKIFLNVKHSTFLRPI